MMALSLEVAVAVAIWTEVLLYGVYTSLFFESIFIMFKKRSTSANPAKVFLVSTILMYLVATAHIVVNLFRLIRLFIFHDDLEGLSDYLMDFQQWDTLAHNVMIAVMTWLGDALVIYRCFIIWDNNYYVIVLPVILLLLSIATNATLFQWYTHPGAATTSQEIPWLNTIYPFAFVQNVMTTGMIALKIWRQHRASNAFGVVDITSRLSLINIMRVVVESAMIYTVQLLILIILYPLHHNAQFIVQSAVVPSIGIVFVLIAVRVHFMKSRTLFGDTVMAVLPTWLEQESGTNSNVTIPRPLAPEQEKT
ncbi:hypothetical protein BDQ17DRAFT_1304591 [Cyathus striatus]|nr:hypothetical protein BDQ17DRAFT_1304591 [Cyathus striatus]